jgi:hypothetical protein
MVIIKGQVITNKSICKAEIADNWNNSMAEYYPVLWVYSMVDGKPQAEQFDVSHISNDPYTLRTEMQVFINEEMLFDYKAYQDREEYNREFPIVRKGKIVEVVKGRKVPIGTVGRCFWAGQTKFGMACGIELDNGSKVFTNYHNVKVIAMGASNG